MHRSCKGDWPLKSDFLKLSPHRVAREFLFARQNLVLVVRPLFLSQFGQTKVLRTPKIMLFPVIPGFLPESESKFGLSRANTTPRDKRGVTTSKNPTLVKDSMKEQNETKAFSDPERLGKETPVTSTVPLERYFEELGFGWAQIIIWTALFISCGADLVQLLLTSLTITQIQCDWNLGSVFETLLTSSSFIAFALGSILFGSAPDKYGRKRVLIISLSTMILAGLVTAVSPNKYIYLISRVIAGFCISSNITTEFVYIGEVVGSKFREFGATGLNIFWTLGVLLQGISAWALLSTIGWRWFSALMCVPAMIPLAGLLLIPESPRYLVVSGERRAAEEALKWLFEKNGVEYPLEWSLETFQNQARGRLSDLFIPQFRRDTLIITIIYSGLLYVVYAIDDMAPLILSETTSCGNTESTPYNTTANYTMTPTPSGDCVVADASSYLEYNMVFSAEIPGALLGLAVGKYIGRKNPIRVLLGIHFLCVALLMINCLSTTAITIILYFVRLTEFAGVVLWWFIAGDIYPTVISSTAINFTYFFSKLAGSFSSFFAYYVYLYDPKLSVVTMAVAALLSLTGALALNKETRGTETQAVIVRDDKKENGSECQSSYHSSRALRVQNLFERNENGSGQCSERDFEDANIDTFKANMLMMEMNTITIYNCNDPLHFSADCGIEVREGITFPQFVDIVLIEQGDSFDVYEELMSGFTAMDIVLEVWILLWHVFLGQFGQTKVLRTPKIMLFPVIPGFLPESESKFGLSRANTTRRATKGG
eukprot:sb/3462320/